MNLRNAHRPPQRIAEGSLVVVDQCDCGTLHVHIGALTLRLDVPTLRDLLNTLGRALAVRTAADYTAGVLPVRAAKPGVG